MRIQSRHFGTSAEPDMTPMIDVTFQLIAFFMFVLNFSEVDQDQRVNLPRSSNGKSISVASMRVVSSMDTRSTQSKVSRSGRLSSTSMVRARMIGSKLRRFSAPVTGATTRRCRRCWPSCEAPAKEPSH